MKRRLYQGTDFRRAQNIDELRAVARRRVPNFCFEYVEGGADDEVTLRRNRSVFEEIGFVPRTLVDVSARGQTVDLFGKPSAAPFLIGPTGFSGLLAREGDLALARAAAAAGIPFVLSNASTMRLEEVADRAGGRLWMQLYLYRTRAFAAKLVERAKAAGLEALVVTTDSAIFGNREWDRRNYARPLKLNLRNTIDVALHPRWILDVLVPNGVPRFANLGDLLPPGQDSVRGAASAIAKELDPSLDWADIRWLRDLWPGKLIVKGVMTAEDAALAADCGADGIVLSNHGGRQLDGAVSTMEVLPEVAAEVGGRLTVMLDGGFRRGSDIVKARALGADAVLLGRATTYGLAAGGEAGVAHAIDILKTEVDRVVGLLGCADLSQLDTSFLRWTGRPMPPARNTGPGRGILSPVAALATNSNQKREAQI
ncbi:alpha-hydroxy-acid oxidizing protein [Skermanella mucosa]|uniref:alpha-hydroxy acid oxidase n=1 Tax=Skermanella mucosa TaxID=1789672 RepID=UPI00192AB1FC|nr:alpha-hydroxy acid oxidase [Skermanella mucosa]UEM19056.1 alpha-hydroxy-acid oxidizing protein [Skermanella mucosa]